MCPVCKVTIRVPSAATLRGNVAKLLLLKPRCSRGEERVSNSCGGRRHTSQQKSVRPLSAEAEQQSRAERSRLSRGQRHAPGGTSGNGGRRENRRRGYDRKARVINPWSTRRLLCKESGTMETSADHQIDPDRSTDSKRFDSRPFRNRQRKKALSKTITRRKGGTHALDGLVRILRNPWSRRARLSVAASVRHIQIWGRSGRCCVRTQLFEDRLFGSVSFFLFIFQFYLCSAVV